ncbi:hypothetical protein D3C75_740800 [compost metagenome]
MTTELGQLQVDGLGGGVQVLLGVADGAVSIEGIGGFRANVGVGDCLHPWGQTIGLLQRLQPELPVFAPHHCDGVADLLRSGRRQGLLHQGVLLQIQPPAAEGLARGLEHRAHLATIRQHPEAARQGVDHQIHLAQLLADAVDGLLAQGVGEGIADQVDGDASLQLRRLAKPDVVVPARAAEPLVGRPALERDAQGVGAGPEGQRYARRQPEAGGGPQHQHSPGPVEGARRLDAGDLLLHGGAAADGMAVAGHATLDLGMNDHERPPLELATA